MKVENNIILGFDGPDNVGKSTQIKKVRKYFSELSFVVLNIESPIGASDCEKIKYGKENSLKNMEAVESIFQKGIPQILDRTHFSEYAYSFLRGGHDLEDFMKMEKDFESLKKRFFVIVFVDEVENIQTRDDGLSAFDPEKVEDIKKILKNFKDVSKKSIFKNVTININQKTEAEVFEEVLENINNF